MKEIIGFGAVNLDLFFQVSKFTRLNKKIVAQGFAPFIYGGEDRGEANELSALLKLIMQEAEFKGYSGGGSAANVVLAGARMGLKTGIVGKIGCQQISQLPDIRSDFLKNSLKGVDTTGLIVKDGLSGICLCLIDESGERSLRVFPHINDTLTFEEIDLSYINNCHFLHLTSFWGDSPYQAQIRIVQQLPEEVKLSIDPGNLYANRGLKVLKPIIRHCFAIFVTRDELELLTKCPFDQGCKLLLELGPKILVLKMGSDGSLIYSEDGKRKIEAQPASSLDSTGAGDVYAAAFIYGLIEGKSLTECGKMASKAAAISLSALGRRHYPTKKEILNYIK